MPCEQFAIVPIDPVGAIIAYGGSGAPSGWLLCNGQSTSGYAALASIVGSNVPNYTSKDLYPYIIKTWFIINYIVK